MNHSQELNLALEITKSVGKFIRESKVENIDYFREKGKENHIATNLDHEASEKYVDFFKKNTPDITIYSEEGPQHMSDKTWVIDPIEGTSNYRYGMHYYATQVSLLENQQPIVSVIYMPVLDLCVYAEKSVGAFCNGSKLHIINSTPLKDSIIALTRGGSNDRYIELIERIKDHVHTIRVYGATGADLAHVAMSHIPLFITSHSQIYDILPGALIVQEAGGLVKDISGEEYTFESKSIVAGSSDIVNEFFSLT